jgi:deoxyribodipyrimidine photo-lyase
MLSSAVPTARVRTLNERVFDPAGGHVLYWMTSARRMTCNFALERAVEWARELGRGVVVLEALRCDYKWASDRFHRFILDGMIDNARDAQGREGLAWYPYVERTPGAGKGLLEALAASAAVVVTDDYPTFRRYLQKSLPNYLGQAPEADPIEWLKGIATPAIPVAILERWPSAAPELSSGGPELAGLPLDHSVAPSELRGGTRAAGLRLQQFLRYRLSAYADDRNHPDEDAASGLSPYLHFGHISVHEILDRLAERESWTPDFDDRPTNGKRTGWWGMSPAAEAFLDQVVTWRELGFNMAANRPDHREYESLPDWALQTLEAHAADARPHLYSLEEFQAAATHDELWNAAQRQLLRDGIIHNYLRMLWGKKILHWTDSPQEALEVMIELNNKYALDGWDPNSYSGIFWVLGRYDRPWGPERPIFGKIRYMASENTARKLRVSRYVEKYQP